MLSTFGTNLNGCGPRAKRGPAKARGAPHEFHVMVREQNRCSECHIQNADAVCTAFWIWFVFALHMASHKGQTKNNLASCTLSARGLINRPFICGETPRFERWGRQADVDHACQPRYLTWVSFWRAPVGRFYGEAKRKSLEPLCFDICTHTHTYT